MITRVLVYTSVLLFTNQEIFAQVRPPWTLTVNVVDIYEALPVYNAEVKLFWDGQLLDTGTTNAAGVVQFTVDFSATGVEEVPSHDVVLLPAYPNPFTGKTTVPFGIERFTQVSAGLFDLLGRQVALRQQVLPAGSHEVLIDLSGQAPNIYILRLNGNDKSIGTANLVHVGPGGNQAPASLSFRESHFVPITAPSSSSKASLTNATGYEIEVSKDGYDTRRYLITIVGDTSLTAELLLREINTVGMELLRIPAGTFTMGDIAGTGDEDERPAHQVTLSHEYYVAKYETTQGEYKAVMGSGANIRPFGFSGDERLPAERISWFEAIRFANTMSESEGLALCYHTDGSVIDGNGNPYECEGYRLPMEAEWEHAVRAGTTRAYSFGDDIRDLDQYAWYSGNADSRTHPVGEKLPNPWGLFDVHGNVNEWIFDRKSSSYYSWSPDVDPYGPGSGSSRVLRGGSWLTGDCRSAGRQSTDPIMYNTSWGVRLARTVK